MPTLTPWTDIFTWQVTWPDIFNSHREREKRQSERLIKKVARKERNRMVAIEKKEGQSEKERKTRVLKRGRKKKGREKEDREKES